MRISKLNYVAVGLFVMAAIFGLVVTIAMLTGRTGDTDEYFAVYRNVTGIKFGTQVIYEGYPIGQVEQVTPEESAGGMVFRVDFGINKGWRLPTDSRVEIAAPGLLAAKTLSIHAGASKAALKPGSQVTSIEAGDIFGAMSSLADKVSGFLENEVKQLLEGDVKTLMGNLTEVVGGINTFLTGDGKVLVKDVSVLVKDLSVQLPAVVADVQSFTRKMERSAAEILKLVSPENRAQVEEIIANLGSSTANLDTVLKTINGVMNDLDKMVRGPEGDVGTILSETRYVVESVSRHVDSINQNLEGAARNMNEFSRQIRANPGLLLGGTPQEDQNKTR